MKKKGILHILTSIELYLFCSIIFLAAFWLLIQDNQQLYSYFANYQHAIVFLSVMYIVLCCSSFFIDFLEIFIIKRFDILHILFVVITTAVILAIGLYFSTIRNLYIM